jgi:seryl-tRNA synthetase
MSNRVSKSRAKPCSKSSEQRSVLLGLILSHPSAMANTCSSCEQSNRQCIASESDSSRCSECVRQGLSRCDIAGLSPQQLRRIAAHHSRFESELESAEATRRNIDAKIERLRKQKKLWFEKMMRAVARGIDNVEELERVEREEMEREAAKRSEASSSSVPIGRSSSVDFVSAEFEQEWAEHFGSVPLDPALMEDFDVAALSYDIVSADAERPSGS